MRSRQIIAFAIVALFSIAPLTACGKASTPTDGFKAFYEAAKNKDAAGLKKAISKKLLADLENRAKRDGKSLDEFLLEADASPAMPEVRNEKIDGDTATLEVKGRGDTWRSMKLVKEDDTWKLDSD